MRTGAVRAAGLTALDALEVRAWRPNFTARSTSARSRTSPTGCAVHSEQGVLSGPGDGREGAPGTPPRWLALLHLDGSGGELPEAGALVFLAGESGSTDARPVGRVTRAALHYEWGGIALALLKRSVAEDAALEVRTGRGPRRRSSQRRKRSSCPQMPGARNDIPG